MSHSADQDSDRTSSFGSEDSATDRPGDAPRRAGRRASRSLWLFSGCVLGACVGWIIVSGAWGRWFGHTGPFAEVRILRDDPYFMFALDPPQSDVEFEDYRQTQAKLVKSDFVLNAVLREPTITQLQVVRELEAPREWLEEAIVIDFPDKEFMRISIRGIAGRDAARLVNAIVDAYIRGVANEEELTVRTRKSKLERTSAKLQESTDRHRLHLRTFQEKITPDASSLEELNRESARDMLGSLRSRIVDTSIRLQTAREELKRLTAEPPVPVQIDEADVEAAVDRDPVVVTYVARRGVLRELQTAARPMEGDDRRQTLQERLSAVEHALEARRTEIRPTIRQRLEQAETERSRRPAAELTRTIQRLEAESAAGEQHFSQLAMQTEPQQQQSAMWSYELEELEAQIRREEKLRDQFEDEIRKLDIELDNWQPRITMFRHAEVAP